MMMMIAKGRVVMITALKYLFPKGRWESDVGLIFLIDFNNKVPPTINTEERDTKIKEFEKRVKVISLYEKYLTIFESMTMMSENSIIATKTDFLVNFSDKGFIIFCFNS